MPELVRVKLPNGVEKTLPENHPAVTAEGVEILGVCEVECEQGTFFMAAPRSPTTMS